MKKIIHEFRIFAIKGNMFDMAIGIIIGAAFSKVVTSLVNDVILPPFGYILGKFDLSGLKFILQEDLLMEGEAIKQEIAINYGIFLSEILNFFIVAFSIFFVIKTFNQLKNKAQNPENKNIETPKDIELLAEIRDLLKFEKKAQ